MSTIVEVIIGTVVCVRGVCGGLGEAIVFLRVGVVTAILKQVSLQWTG